MPYVSVELASDCLPCGRPLSQRILTHDLACECGRHQPWSPRTWSWFLDRAADVAMGPPGEKKSWTVKGGGDSFVKTTKEGVIGPFPARLTIERTDVVCPKCGHALDQMNPGAAPCPGCGAKIRVRATPKNTPWAPLYVTRSVGEELGPRFFVWIDEGGVERERMIEARWKATGIGCVTSLVILALIFVFAWWKFAFEAAWQAVLIATPMLFVLNTAVRMATPLFVQRRKKQQQLGKR